MKKKQIVKPKTFEEVSFEEFVDNATREIHSGLLQGGSNKMREKVHLYMVQAIRWSKVK